MAICSSPRLGIEEMEAFLPARVVLLPQYVLMLVRYACVCTLRVPEMVYSGYAMGNNARVRVGRAEFRQAANVPSFLCRAGSDKSVRTLAGLQCSQ